MVRKALRSIFKVDDGMLFPLKHVCKSFMLQSGFFFNLYKYNYLESN